METPRILVTGGTGLVGRSIVRGLIAAKVPVRVLTRSDRRTSNPTAALVRGDITSAADLRSAMAGCSVVIHCAAEKGDVSRMRSTNVEGTRLVFELARDCGIGVFCHLSTVGVIGRTSLKVVEETSACRPANFYERTKLEAEQIVNRGLAGGRVVILRPTNVFGPETLSSWLSGSLRARVRLALTGHARAHLVYVEDVAAAALYCLRSEEMQKVETFIVSSDEERENTVLEVQASLAGRLATAPKALAWAAPLFVTRALRRLRGGNGNSCDVVYSSRRLLEAGCHFPYGLANGLRDACLRYRVTASIATNDPRPVATDANTE